ncbi:hypothetical protein M758_6G200000 [Ceratodon purpureus]|nr:hypothetical protein M758_6G200000 [Ceratodon purpureus]
MLQRLIQFWFISIHFCDAQTQVYLRSSRFEQTGKSSCLIFRLLSGHLLSLWMRRIA